MGLKPRKVFSDWALDHQSLWNRVEARETRKDAQLLRDYELVLQCELDSGAHVQMVQTFAQSIVEEFVVAVGWGIHLPRDISDERNIVEFILLLPGLWKTTHLAEKSAR